jgi:CRISPR/Cas system-associated protein Csm6
VLHSDCDDEITICAELHLVFCCMTEADVDFAEQYFYETSTANQQIEA